MRIEHGLLMERAGEIVVVDHVVSALRTQDHGKQVPAAEFRALVALLGAPRLALGLNLAHPDRDLRRAQVVDGDQMQNGFADRYHRASSITRPACR